MSRREYLAEAELIAHAVFADIEVSKTTQAVAENVGREVVRIVDGIEKEPKLINAEA